MTFPSGEAQEQLIRSVYKRASLAPESLEYIEAHGTGTKVRPCPHPATVPARLPCQPSPCPPQVGDPQELNSIVRALCASRQGPLLVGSTKSNMGHPEPASGLAALSKVGAELAPEAWVAGCELVTGPCPGSLWGWHSAQHLPTGLQGVEMARVTTGETGQRSPTGPWPPSLRFLGVGGAAGSFPSAALTPGPG